MYEKFTDRARKVMQLANQEAQYFNHEYVGTEHILLGLIKEGSGLAAHVLKDFNMDVPKVRAEVEKIAQRGPNAVFGKQPQTPRTKKVLEYAHEEATKLGHNYVGSGHLLLGILRLCFERAECVAGSIFSNLGHEPEEIIATVIELLFPTNKTKGQLTEEGIIEEEGGEEELAPQPTVYETRCIHLLPERYDCDQALEEMIRVRFNLSERIKIAQVIIITETA